MEKLKFIYVLGLIIIFMCNGFILIMFHQMDKIISDEVKSPQNNTVLINQLVTQEFDKIILNNNEQSICLTGYNNTINGYYYVQTESTPNTVRSECKKPNTIGKAHTHPNGNCEQSNADIVNGYLTKMTYVVIICDQQTYSFYTYQQDDTALTYYVYN